MHLRNCNVHRIIRSTRSVSSDSSTTSNSNISPIFTNRNPRNLEKMRIGYKPSGYHLEKPGKCYWHCLDLSVSQKHATAVVKHFENGEVIKASTAEWAIKKHLYSTKDTTALINLGRIIGYRCLQSGILEMSCNVKPTKEDGKVALFLKAVEESGVTLQEPPQFKAAAPWDQLRPEKPWEVTDA